MKKKRKNRWKNGIINKKKCSHVNSKDNSNIAESGDEEEDEEEDGKPAESEDPEKMKDVECETMEVEEPTTSTSVVQKINFVSEEQEDNTAAAVDEVVNIENVQINTADKQHDVQPLDNNEPKRTEPIVEDDTEMG